MREPNFQFIDVGNVKLRVVVQGEGPLCVLVHGFPESWYSWRKQIPALVHAGYRVAVPDVRGYGGSDAPEAIDAYNIAALSDDIAGLIAALGEQSAVLVGHDWGAPIVWTTALRHSDKVRAVVGLSVPYLGRGDRPLIDVLKQVYKDKFFYQLYFQEPGVAEAELNADVEVTLKKFYVGASADRVPGTGLTADRPVDSDLMGLAPTPTHLPAWISQQDIEYYASQFQGRGFAPALNRYRNSQLDFDLTADLADKKITQPAQFMIGLHDEVMNFIPGVRLHDLMDPNYEDLRSKVEIEGAGHWVQQEQPEQVNAALLAFLADL